MKTKVSLLFLLHLFAVSFLIQAADTIQVKQTKTPILIDRTDNVLFYVRINAENSKELSDIKLRFSEEVNLSEIAAVKLYYSGTEAPQRSDQLHFAPVGQYISSHSPGKTLSANPFLPPRLDRKYSRGVNPIRKFDLTGTSTFLPEVFDMIPRIPHSCST